MGIVEFMKKASVIIPIHNSSKYIEECLESVINQTYKDIEIIIVDDASTDNSLELVKNINDNRIKIIELKENAGAANARNKGIENATGNYICFLDSDDYWVLDKLEKQVKFIEDNNYIFIYSSYDYFKKGKRKKAKVPKSLNYDQLLKNHAIFTSTVMLNMKYLTKEDIYMPNIKKGQDTATWWKILKKGITAYSLPDILAIYRVGEASSLSSNKIKALKRTWQLFKTENIGFVKRIYYFLSYIYYAIKRRMSL